MATIDHYMVDYLGVAGDVLFANDTPIQSLTEAKSLASKTSREINTGAYVVAFAQGGNAGEFVSCGHISFFDGRQYETDGTVI